MNWLRARVPAWLREHTPTVVVALVLFFISTQVTGAVRQVPRNSADIKTVCAKVNKVNDALDRVVKYSLRNVDEPAPHVADPEVQKLIDKGRAEARELKKYAAQQHTEAHCRVK